MDDVNHGKRKLNGQYAGIIKKKKSYRDDYYGQPVVARYCRLNGKTR